MKALFALYNILLEAVYFLLFPFIYIFLKKKNYLAAILPDSWLKVEDKGGTYSFNEPAAKHVGSQQKTILFHAASMGEVNAVKPLILELISLHRDIRIVITTSTITGLNLAQSISPGISVYLSSLDIKHLRDKQLKSLNPDLICIVETEIWFNMLAWASKHKIPVLFLNARMSARSQARYHRIKRLLHLLEGSIVAIHAQSAEDAQRFFRIFNKPSYNSGNLKYALKLPEYDQRKLRAEWGFSDTDFIICWGSSRPGEEELLLSVLPRLKAKIPNLKLIVAPRHLNRLGEVRALCKNVPYSLFSEDSSGNRGKEMLIIDVMGVLSKAYAISDLAVVGGSFFAFGGHNPLEPAFYGKAIIIGKFHQSCRESVSRLQQGNAIMVSEPLNLAKDILSLSDNPMQRKAMGANAKKVLTDNSGALAQHLDAIEKLLEK